jgi:hypothetical protein
MIRSVLFVVLAVAAACAKPEIDAGKGAPGNPGGPGAAGTGGSSGGSPSSPSSPSGGGPSFVLPDAAPVPPSSPSTMDDKDKKCAEDVAEAKQVPVDLLLLVDSSGSMDTEVVDGGDTKWVLVRNALTTFVGDVKSSGLGVGMQFFPKTSQGSACMTSTDCSFSTCRKTGVCMPTNGATPPPLATAQRCGRQADRACPRRTRCTDLGKCSVSGEDCVIGQACPGGAAAGTCMPVPGMCRGGATSCQAADYEQPAVGIADLPGARMPLATALMGRTPAGGTPMGAAVEGALKHLGAHAAASPTRRPVLVLATDGVPDGCPDDEVAPIVARIEAARMASPTISTYVIGVFAPDEQAQSELALKPLATAGGTGTPFILNPGEDLTQRFLDALNQIRGSVLACEFEIPASQMGLDYKKVNVSLTSAGGDEEILYAGTMNRCDPVKGGWYYDVDPDAGGRPTKVIVCPATCQRFKTEPTARVNLRFGCARKYIP